MNITKKGLSTTESVINEEFTLRYGHIFRGLSAYEYAVKGGFEGTKEEYEAYVGNIGNLSEEAREAAAYANETAGDASSMAEYAREEAGKANIAATNANKAAGRVEIAITSATTAASSANAAAEEATKAANKANEAAGKITEFEENINNKANKEGYYPEMTVGKSDNLVGRGEATQEEFSFRPSAGSVSIEDGTARITSVKGNSVVWNQLLAYEEVKNMNDEDSSLGCWFVRQGKNNAILSGKSLTINFVSTISSSPNMSQRVNFVKGCKYLFYIKYKLNGEPASYGVSFRISSSPVQTGGNSTIIQNFSDLEGESSFIYTADRNNPYVLINPTNPTNDIGQYLTVECTIIDLTKMFGVDNEPKTIEEFNERKPYIVDEYAYNEGEVISMNVDSIKSVGNNAYDYTKGYARVMGGYKYDITANAGATLEVLFYADGEDSNVDEREIAPDSEGKYTFPANGTCYVDGDYANTRDICVCLNHSYEKPITPYEEDVVDVSWVREVKDSEDNLLFPNGLRSADTVYDEIRFNKTTKKWEAVKRIGEVDLGSLNWSAFTINGYDGFKSISNNLGAKPLSTKNIAVCALYANEGLKWYYEGLDKCVAINHGYFTASTHMDSIVVRDTAYTDVASFKDAMNGVMLYYELSEPIVTTIENSENLNLDYLVWDFGTEEAIASVPSTPFKADIIYQFNAVDRIRDNSRKVDELENIIKQLQSQIATMTVQQINDIE